MIMDTTTDPQLSACMGESRFGKSAAKEAVMRTAILRIVSAQTCCNNTGRKKLCVSLGQVCVSCFDTTESLAYQLYHNVPSMLKTEETHKERGSLQ